MNTEPSSLGEPINENPKYRETIGVNGRENIIPFIENTNDIDAMARMEGQLLGQIGGRPMAWPKMVIAWLATGAPAIAFTLILFGHVNSEYFWPYQFMAGLFLLILCVIIHVPFFLAVKIIIMNHRKLNNK